MTSDLAKSFMEIRSSNINIMGISSIKFDQIYFFNVGIFMFLI